MTVHVTDDDHRPAAAIRDGGRGRFPAFLEVDRDDVRAELLHDRCEIVRERSGRDGHRAAELEHERGLRRPHFAFDAERTTCRLEPEHGQRRPFASGERRRCVGRGDATGGLDEPTLPQPPLPHGRHDRCADAGDMARVDVMAQAQRVRTREQRENRTLCHPHGGAHGLHLEGVRDDEAGESELFAEQAGEVRRAEGGRCVSELGDDQMRRHDGARAGGDRRPKRRELHLHQLVTRRSDHG